MGFLYWTRKPVDVDPVTILERADPSEVRRVLELRSGGLAMNEANDFYLLAVSGNGGRLLVRSWIHDSLERVLRNVGGWFDGLQIMERVQRRNGGSTALLAGAKIAGS